MFPLIFYLILHFVHIMESVFNIVCAAPFARRGADIKLAAADASAAAIFFSINQICR